jgi:hypothetical protein
MIENTILNLKYKINGEAKITENKNSCLITSSKLINLKIDIPEESLFFWPNREGELIESRNINNILSENNISEASICYPATASMLFFIIFNQKTKEGRILYSNPDIDGKIAIFSLNKGISGPYLQIKSDKIELNILRQEGDSLEAIVDDFIKENRYSPILPLRTKISNYQVQLGFFNPYGKHNIPDSRGFGICEDIAKLMRTNIGFDNIIHIFAYHGAHDSNYPEYSPSQELGGPEGLKNAIANIHKEKQRCSLYMNARLFSKVLLEKYPHLENSIVIDSKGDRVIETYYDRDFYVMDPLSEDWRTLLIEKALYLKSLGVDIIQLDQVAGRAAIGPIGYKWGHGYRLLIKAIEKLGLEVWIQGINEIYPANRFELCFRYPNILIDGTVRGGQPFGVSYPLIPRLLNNQNFIIPLGSKNLLKDIDNKNVTIDLEHLPGELSIYSQQYMENLTNIFKEYNLSE